MKTISKVMIILISILVGGFVACAIWEGDETDTPPRELPQIEAPPPIAPPPVLRTVEPPQVKPPPVRPVNPYRYAQTWCEPHWDMGCKEDADCEDVVDPTGLRTYCSRPRWAMQNNADVKVCMPGRYGPARKEYMRKRLRVYVDHVCEPPDWWETETPCWKYRHQTAAKCRAKKYCDPDDLHDFLRVPAQRESNWKCYEDHVRNPDVRANKTAWVRYAHRYRWHVETDKFGDVVTAYPTLPGYNRHYGDRHRWRGLGLYGQNTPLWITTWDMRAPPEAFCREVPSSEAYLRAARSNWRKINNGVDCDDDGEKDWWGSGVLEDGSALPTWADIHQATSTGKLCPRQKSHDAYAARARKIDIDPDEPIELVRLGERMNPGRQNIVMAWLEVRMDLIPKPGSWLSDLL